MTHSHSPTVLIVDDEEAYVEAFSRWLSDDYDVRTATSGFEALEKLDESVDVVLLDRRMPRVSGDDVLAEIRERDVDCRVAMVTAIDPGVDIVDMKFDEYLVKPASKDEVRAVIEDLLRRSSLDSHLQRCFSLVSKKVTLEANMERDDLQSSSQYRDLVSQLEETELEADRELTDLIETGNVAAVFHDIES